jgi:Fe-S-cluster containining protein
MVKCLNFHAPYRCRNTGVCCRAGWTITFSPIERTRIRGLQVSSGSIVALRDGRAAAARQADGTCAFFDADTHLCGIHSAGGHAALPLACRMFPRSVLHDARGTFVSLSHFCPTAAALLFDSSPPAAIVDAPASLTAVGALDGLDARRAWPPLLRPGVLMDLESYASWERLGIELLTRENLAPSAALAALDAVSRRIASWTPGGPPDRLVDLVRESFAGATLRETALETRDRAVKRWLAARLFACWVAYQGDGIAAIVAYLRQCLARFDAELARDGSALEAIRRSDFQIMHTS